MRTHNRRQFLEDSMFAAAAAVASGAVPVLADEAKQSSSPNEKLGVGVVGVNGRGRSHLNAFSGRRDTEVVCICDADEAVGQRQVKHVAERQDRAPSFVQDLRKMLEDPQVDIVSIATPNHWHALGAIWAMQAGKDVYVEKPVSHNVLEGRITVQVARKEKKICQTGTQCRSSAGLQEAIAFLRAGGIGKIQVARGLCYKSRGSIGPRGSYQPPASVNYDLWLGPAPMQPVTRQRFHYDWHWQWPYGNGDLGNQGIHQMDLARWGLGVNQLSNAVISYGGRFGYEDAGDTANTQVVLHDYGDQSLVFEVRGLKTSDLKGAKVGVIFEGTDGYLVMPSYSSATAFDKDGTKIKEFNGGGDHFANFLEAVRSRNSSDLAADIEEGHLSSALCHLGNISYRLGESLSVGETLERLQGLSVAENVKQTLDRTVDHLTSNGVNMKTNKFQLGQHLPLDPQSERFTEHEKANQMLTREYRAPYIVPSSVQA